MDPGDPLDLMCPCVLDLSVGRQRPPLTSRPAHFTSRFTRPAHPQPPAKHYGPGTIAPFSLCSSGGEEAGEEMGHLVGEENTTLPSGRGPDCGALKEGEELSAALPDAHATSHAHASSSRKRPKPKRAPPKTPPAFLPEPEIQLRHRPQKKEAPPHAFAPYVHTRLSTCTVVNSQEEHAHVTRSRRPQSASGDTPTTSCLRLGRVSDDARAHAKLLCCLCGGGAGGLGDLHGPYCRERGVSCEGADPELWIHEDCVVWAAGVFLVKGKLYGLEEAVRLAHATVCWCCRRGGATLGCFFKNCPHKYHFPCALTSDCVLSEENFTIRCPTHKSKVWRASISRLRTR